MVEKGAVKECVLEFGVLYLKNKTQWFLKTETWEKGSPGCSLLCLVTLLLPFIVSQLINLFNKNDLHEGGEGDGLGRMRDS